MGRWQVVVIIIISSTYGAAVDIGNCTSVSGPPLRRKALLLVFEYLCQCEVLPAIFLALSISLFLPLGFSPSILSYPVLSPCRYFDDHKTHSRQKEATRFSMLVSAIPPVSEQR